MTIRYFNSIKVRLKLIKVLIYALGLIFQFHKGTIKTKFPKRDKSGAVVFQFHKGTLKTTRWYHFIDINKNFNSIKVRLKRMFLCKSRINSSTFQFHKGTIKTRIFNPVVSVAFEFQFHKGTIKTRIFLLILMCLFISIP